MQKDNNTGNFNPNAIDFEPKLAWRFIVEFPAEFGIDSRFVRMINKPIFKDNKWQKIEVIFMDIIGPSVATQINKLKKYCNTSFYFFRKKPMFSFYINSLDPTGVVIESWKIDVKSIYSIDFGNLDQNSNDIQKIKIIIEPLDCNLLP